jgi:predicted metal-dependent phosphoesterase TrpH
MQVRVDLHIHTTASDGCWTPEEAVSQVLANGIGLFAVTDHDSVGSLALVSELVAGTGVGFLPGVELSARQNGQTYHLLAYGLDPTNPELRDLVEDNNRSLLSASDRAVERLVEAGYPVSMSDYDAYQWDRGRGGWKALNFLIDRGLCQDVSSYFGELFGHQIAHPEAEFPPPEEVIDVAASAGALVILAHPGAAWSNGLDDSKLDALVDTGLSGLECYSSYHSQDQAEAFRAYCDERRLLVTGGSDCHGGFVNRELGVPVVWQQDLRLGPLAERVVK